MVKRQSSWQGHRAIGRGRRRGFTLLEVIISLALMIMMMAGIYEFYLTTLKARQSSIKALHDTLLMRSILEQMANDIRQATSTLPGDGQGFMGTEEQITIVRTRLPDGSAFDTYDNSFQGEASPGRQEIVRISYYRERDNQIQDDDGTDLCRGLVREQSRILDPSSGGVIVRDSNPQDADNDFSLDMEGPMGPQVDRELIAPEIRYLKFEYLDGKSWHKSWQPVEDEAENGESSDEGDLDPNNAGRNAPPAEVALPQAVRITIGREKKPWMDDLSLSRETEDQERRTYHADRWVLEVYLRQADQTMLSSRQYGQSLGDEESETVEQTEGGRTR